MGVTRPAAATTLQRLVWTGGAETPLGCLLGAGALVWLCYAVVQVVVEGPVIDEALMPAQILSGAVTYPAGHPMAVYCESAPSLSYWLAAATYRLWPDTWALSASRNVLFLFASAFTPFALACVMTRRPAWGHVATALTLSEAATRFIGIYLLWVFPAYYSSGHLGIHAAVLVAALLVAGCRRSGALLLGLMPSLHVAMTLVIWPWAGLWALATLRGRAWRPVLAWTGAGLAVSAAVVAIARLASSSTVALPPYDATADAARIFDAFVATTDPHRQPIRLLSGAYLTSPIAFALLGLLAVQGAGARARERAWLLLPGVIAWTYVFGTRALEAVTDVPYAVLVVMPGRYANLAVLYLLPLTVVCFAEAAARLDDGRRRAALALLVGVLAVEVAMVLVDRDLAFAHLLPGLWGVLLVVEAVASPAPGRRALVVAGGLALGLSFVVAAAVAGETGAPAFAAGAVVGLAVMAVAERMALPGWSAREGLLAAAVVVAALVGLRGPYLANRWDVESERLTAWDARLIEWLAANASPGEMLLTPVWPLTGLQPKTGHPVLIDSFTLLTMTYKPSLAAPIGTVTRELFGIDYADPERLRAVLDADGLLRPSSPAWLAAWRTRRCAEWVRLGRRFDVRLVVSPRSTPLDLPQQLAGDAWALYVIPSSADACPTGST